MEGHSFRVEPPRVACQICYLGWTLGQVPWPPPPQVGVQAQGSHPGRSAGPKAAAVALMGGPGSRGVRSTWLRFMKGPQGGSR